MNPDVLTGKAGPQLLFYEETIDSSFQTSTERHSLHVQRTGLGVV